MCYIGQLKNTFRVNNHLFYVFTFRWQKGTMFKMSLV